MLLLCSLHLSAEDHLSGYSPTFSGWLVLKVKASELILIFKICLKSNSPCRSVETSCLERAGRSEQRDCLPGLSWGCNAAVKSSAGGDISTSESRMYPPQLRLTSHFSILFPFVLGLHCAYQQCWLHPETDR